MRYKLLLITVFCSLYAIAQELSIVADVRSRFEYRHGFNSLVPSEVDPAAFVQQRSRLALGYKSELLNAKFSFQDIRIWGDTRQILSNDVNNNFQLAETWVQLIINESWSTKIGRQMLSYDDERILGSLDWAMQGRFHDAALVNYSKGNSKLDLVFSFSQNDDAGNPGNISGNIFDVAGFFSYKAMQLMHYNIKPSDNVNISLLALNNTFQNRNASGDAIDGFYHRHTFGTHSKFQLGSVGLAFNGYFQTGEANTDTDLSAYLIGLEANTKGKTSLGLGFEIQSGTDNDATDGKNRSFFPLYGTNHKFNGLLDYFYVGNHADNVGLIDIYAKVNFKTSEKSNLLIAGHHFSASATLIDPVDNSKADSYLGTEIDIVYTQKLLPYATLKVGYSQMFASDSMEILKSQPNASGLQNWGWAMLVVKPNFLKWSPNK